MSGSKLRWSGLMAGCVIGFAGSARAEVIIKADNTDDLNLASSWVGGQIPDSNDIAQWDSTITGSNSVSLGVDTQWLGLNFVAGAVGNLGIAAGNSLTLGAAGITKTDDGSLTVNAAIILSTDQQWSNINKGFTNIGTGSSGIDLAGFNLTIDGPYIFKTDFTNGGEVIFVGGGSKLSNGSAAPDSIVRIRSGATLNFDTGSGQTPDDRAGNMVLEGGDLTISPPSGSNTVDHVGILTAGSGLSNVTISPKTGRNAQLDADSFVRNAGATVLFRGTDLGVNPIATPLGSDTNIQIGSVTLAGGGGATNTSTTSILKGALGDTSTGGHGTALVTYTAANGVQLLSTYADTIIDGQTQLDNVLLANGSGVASVVTLNSDTTINSLSFNVTAADSAVTIDGTGTLTLHSGVIFANSASPADDGAEMTINNTLDLNGTEGIIHFRTAGSSNGRNGALLLLNGAVTNDGGNGLTYSGTAGVVELIGTAANTYTGVTYINGGGVRLARDVDNVAVPGHLVVNGGTLQNTGDQVADTSDITVNGGQYLQKAGATNSGSGASETFRDLFMNGGTYSDGASGTSSGITNLRNAVVTGGTWNVTRGHKTNLSGSLAISGGRISIGAANDTGHTTILTVDGPLSISNNGAGAFAPILIGGGNNTTLGGRLVLSSDVTFTGHARNETPTLIDASAPSNGGQEGRIALDGARTFTIGDGGSDVDLRIVPALVDGTTAGGVNKAGAGTLELAGTNAYSGTTHVEAGTLQITGSVGGTGITLAAGTTLFIGDNAAEGFDNTAIGDTTALTLNEGALVNLGFDNTETIGALTLNGVTYIQGMFDQTSNPEFFSGAGSIVATPEPASLGLLAMGGFGLLARRRRSRRE